MVKNYYTEKIRSQIKIKDLAKTGKYTQEEICFQIKEEFGFEKTSIKYIEQLQTMKKISIDVKVRIHATN